jgi:hypothetical protein
MSNIEIWLLVGFAIIISGTLTEILVYHGFRKSAREGVPLRSNGEFFYVLPAEDYMDILIHVYEIQDNGDLERKPTERMLDDCMGCAFRLIRRGHFGTIDELFKRLDVERMNAESGIALLMITNRSSDQYRNRENFIVRLREVLVSRYGENEAEDALRGFSNAVAPQSN